MSQYLFASQFISFFVGINHLTRGFYNSLFYRVESSFYFISSIGYTGNGLYCAIAYPFVNLSRAARYSVITRIARAQLCTLVNNGKPASLNRSTHTAAGRV